MNLKMKGHLYVVVGLAVALMALAGACNPHEEKAVEPMENQFLNWPPLTA